MLICLLLEQWQGSISVIPPASASSTAGTSALPLYFLGNLGAEPDIHSITEWARLKGTKGVAGATFLLQEGRPRAQGEHCPEGTGISTGISPVRKTPHPLRQPVHGSVTAQRSSS